MLTYLALLLVSLAGLLLIDRRLKLAFWLDRRRTLLTLGIAVLFFLIWDIGGIALDIFRHGSSPYALPFTVISELAVEEFFFLTLLCYQALLIYLWRVR